MINYNKYLGFYKPFVKVGCLLCCIHTLHPKGGLWYPLKRKLDIDVHNLETSSYSLPKGNGCKIFTYLTSLQVAFVRVYWLSYPYNEILLYN